MLRLLLVDDEHTTREGIVENIDWAELCITDIRQADDGVNALKIVESFHPHIILTDVRMPRMDGIEMSYEIQGKYPDCKIIFMSGYSDKEYLLSAIRLKAMNYIEKPIRLEEMTDALRAAAKQCAEEIERRRRECQSRLDTQIILKANEVMQRHELALLLCRPVTDQGLFDRYARQAGIAPYTDMTFRTALIRLLTDGAPERHAELDLIHMRNAIYETLLNGGPTPGVIIGVKNEWCLILHLFYESCASTRRDTEILLDGLRLIQRSCIGKRGHYIAIGHAVRGCGNVHASYESALILMQRAYYRQPGAIILYDGGAARQFHIGADVLPELAGCLSDRNGRGRARKCLSHLTDEIVGSMDEMVVNAKNAYYRCLLLVRDEAAKLRLGMPLCGHDEIELWELFLGHDSVFVSEKLVVDAIEEFYDLAESRSDTFGIADSVQTYIEGHYMAFDLSISSIADALHLSPNYLSTVFKDKTGDTINNYINNTRIEKAKDLLSGSRVSKISDISGRAGYRDQNYFAKLFHKSTGMTPSEYRRAHSVERND